MTIPVAIAEGDGIGPEITRATLRVLETAGAALELHKVEVGEKLYRKGFPSGIDPKTFETLRRTKAFLKGPILVPPGIGFKPLNAAICSALDLYANVRPCIAYNPVIATKHPHMDLVLIRDNEEDLSTGIEYRQTPNVCKSIKLISQPGSEKIIRYAFEYARTHRRKKLACFTNDPLLPFSDGLFHRVFDEVAKEYSDILNEHWTVGLGAAKLADTPEIFDVIVTPHLYGSILSDFAVQMAGSSELASSSSIGDRGAMFEAVHGSELYRAGPNHANPSSLLLAAIQMLLHIGAPQVAEHIHNAWLKTLEEGIHPYDIYREGSSTKKVGTREFTDAVIRNLGKTPELLPKISYPTAPLKVPHPLSFPPPEERKLVGIDVFVYHRPPVESFISRIAHINVGPLSLKMISNRGAMVWPRGQPDTFCIEQWRCRFVTDGKRLPSQGDLFQILHAFDHIGLDVIKSEHLYYFNSQPGYSFA